MSMKIHFLCDEHDQNLKEEDDDFSEDAIDLMFSSFSG